MTRYDKPRCPECEEPADRRDEEVSAACRLVYDEATDTFDFEGETEVLWEGQMVITNPDGSHTLRCPDDHEWHAMPLDEAGKPSPDEVMPNVKAWALLTRLVAETRTCTDFADWAANTKLLDEARMLVAPGQPLED